METAALMLTIAGVIIMALFGLVVGLLAWLGNKAYSKLDEMAASLRSIEGDLRERIGDLDHRVTQVEALAGARQRGTG